MTKHFHVILWIPLLFCALFLVYWIEIYVNEIVEFEHFVLEKQLNYATDSAVEAMLLDADIDPDYAAVGFQKVDPALAKRDLAHTLALDFGYIPTDVTMSKVLNDNVKAIIVAGFDGFYYFALQDTDSEGGWELTQSPKIPYYYEDTQGRQFCLTLDTNYGYYGQLEGDTFKLHNRDYLPANIRPGADVQSAAINNLIAETLNWCLYTGMSKGVTQSVRIPDTSKNLREFQIIDSPTVLCVVEGNKSSFATSIIADSFAGSKIVDNDSVICYTISEGAKVFVNGVPTSIPAGTWYANSSWWDNHPIVNDSKFTNAVMFDTVFEAAIAGYDNLNLMYVE